MIITALRAASFTPIPWKNGGGVSTTIAEALHGAGGGWESVVWRLGFTPILAPGPFSDLAGFDRLQALISGAGLVLSTPRGEVDLRRPRQVARYRGEAPIDATLEDGAVEVINLIGDRARVALDLDRIEAGAERALSAGVHVLWAAEGTAKAVIGGRDVFIPAGDAARVEMAEAAALSLREGSVWLASIMRKAG
jgi:hypothetical protein